MPHGYGTELPGTELAAPELRPPEELRGSGLLWPAPARDFSEALRDPQRGTEPDDGVVLNGLGFFIGAYVSGLFVTSPFVAGGRGSPEFAAFGLVPLAQWAVGFYDNSLWGNSAMIFIAGGFFTGMQLIAGLVIVAGLAHHRDLLRPGQPGAISLTSNGIGVSF